MKKKQRNYFKPSDYTFVICAYKKSPYLEECICSLKKQTLPEPVNILLVTSTPNQHIESMVKKYSLEYYINPCKNGIAEDWNFGICKVKGKLVTIAHQDDIYEPDFAAKTIENLNEQSNPLIAFTNYGELRNSEKIIRNKTLRIKRSMLLPLKNRTIQKIRFVRRRILSMGNMICCPSVTYVKDMLPKTIFESGFRSNIDWQAWEKKSKIKGAYEYSEIIADNDRTKEDYEMLCKFWPEWLAGIIEYFYKNGEDQNTL